MNKKQKEGKLGMSRPLNFYGVWYMVYIIFFLPLDVCTFTFVKDCIYELGPGPVLAAGEASGLDLALLSSIGLFRKQILISQTVT
jgi:hypothetical protein